MPPTVCVVSSTPHNETSAATTSYNHTYNSSEQAHNVTGVEAAGSTIPAPRETHHTPLSTPGVHVQTLGALAAALTTRQTNSTANYVWHQHAHTVVCVQIQWLRGVAGLCMHPSQPLAQAYGKQYTSMKTAALILAQYTHVMKNVPGIEVHALVQLHQPHTGASNTQTNPHTGASQLTASQS